MIKISHVATALLLASISVAHAETANQPVTPGATSVNKNLSKDPDSKGLQKASGQVKENEEKVADKRDNAKHKKDKKEKHEHAGKGDHSKMERPAKPERPGK